MSTERVLVLDIETTGLDIKKDKIIEVGGVLIEGFQEVDKFQYYFNPECPVSPGAFKVHGLSNEFLSQFEPFCCKKIADLCEGRVLVAHNGEKFDKPFIDEEFRRAGLSPLENHVIDTLKMARHAFPGAPVSLDALCKRFGVSNKHRNLHGALVDALLLARVYNCLRNHGLTQLKFEEKSVAQQTLKTCPVKVTEEELKLYEELLDKMASS